MWHFEEVGWGPVRGVGVTLPTLVVSSGLGGMLWWRVETLKGIGVLNGGWAIVALSRCPCTQQVSQMA